MSKQESESELFKKSRDFLEMFKKGEQFTQSLLKENERLRFKILELENQSKSIQRGQDGESLQKLQHAFSQLQQEKEELISRFQEVEAENQDFAQKYVEVEEENNNLANLYVASYQLHSTLDQTEVLRILQEIVINLVGAEQFAILVNDEEVGNLVPVVKEGVDDKFINKVKSNSDVIVDVMRTGESFFKAQLGDVDPDRKDDPLVCIPLKINDKAIGILVIFSLLEQKQTELTRVDYELFSMLAGHAATAIFSSKLYAASERKLSTIQGFIDLLSGGKGKK